jgi:hypothetical protein
LYSVDGKQDLWELDWGGYGSGHIPKAAVGVAGLQNLSKVEESQFMGCYAVLLL